MDSSFDPGAGGCTSSGSGGPNGRQDPGGWILLSHLGGGGTGTTPRNYIGRLNSDGSLDTGFDPGAGSLVYAFALQADGRIVVGGNFTYLGVGGAGITTRSYIARLNSDGSVDDSFDPGASDLSLALALQADGRILVGGNFTTLGGATRNNIGRLNSDGTLDVTFDPGAGGPVYALEVQSDSKILVGGNFTTLDGGGGSGTTARNDIGRLNPDGTLDETLTLARMFLFQN